MRIFTFVGLWVISWLTVAVCLASVPLVWSAYTEGGTYVGIVVTALMVPLVTAAIAALFFLCRLALDHEV